MYKLVTQKKNKGKRKGPMEDGWRMCVFGVRKKYEPVIVRQFEKFEIRKKKIDQP